MRILLWHGYLLGGTGSNVYTRALARAWAQLGHDVVVFSQDPHPERFDLGGAVPTGDAKALSLMLEQLLQLPEDARAELRASARRAAEKLWSWQGVASRLLEPVN